MRFHHVCSFALRGVALFGILLSLAGCQGTSNPGGGSGPAGASGAGGGGLEFWHTRTQHDQEVLEAIVKEFNAKNPGAAITPQYQGDYTQLFQKITASIQTKQLPDLAVAYESMIAEYMAADIVRPLQQFVEDSQAGLDEQSLADIFPSYLEANRFARFDNQLLSFPFTKSNLVMYYNKDRLKQAGFNCPPETWEEFLAQCRIISAKTGRPCWALTLDPSTIDGYIFSFGGELLTEDEKGTLFDQPPTVKMLSLIDTAVSEKLAYQVNPGDENNEFANQNAAFLMRSSAARPFLTRAIGEKFDWDISIIPHAAGVKPVTVMYGPNICIFKSDEEQERRAWEFIKYFTSTEVTARWATQTGYLPVRKSAAETATLKEFFAAHPRNRRAFDMLPYARPEPNIAGWQEVRDLLVQAVSSVITQSQEPAQAARTLKQQSDKVIGSG